MGNPRLVGGGRPYRWRRALVFSGVLLGMVLPCAAEPTEPLLGLGFLWSDQNRPAAAALSSDHDFVDLILGPGRLDIFQHVQPPVKIGCIVRALERVEERPWLGLRETIALLEAEGIDPGRVLLAYNPERSPGTSTAEVENLVESARQARELATAYGAPLLMGPGLGEMQRREHLYPELAANCDIWLIQSQRLQLDRATRRVSPPAEYREKVAAIVESLREGNPAIRIYVQVLASGRPGEPLFSAEEVVAYIRAIEDLVDAARIYGGSGELVREVVRALRPVAEPGEEGEAP